MKAKQHAILHFSRTPLKHPMSKFLLQFLLDSPDLLRRITFVRNRDYLPNTMLISELGSPRVGFELELGARQREEVTIINGQLVRHTRRDYTLCVNEPMEAITALREFRGRLYVVFAFCGPTPTWYERVVEQNPALPAGYGDSESVDRVFADILRTQVDLAILAILTREAIDAALAARDEAAFRRHVAIYREVMQRSLWEF
jgi:uncharacterized protein YpiB (UPF0302 family)